MLVVLVKHPTEAGSFLDRRAPERGREIQIEANTRVSKCVSAFEYLLLAADVRPAPQSPAEHPG